MVDEATPLSYERYTGNWQGSSCGWLLTKQTMPMMIQGMKKTLPGLQQLLHGRAVGGAGRQRAGGGDVGTQRDPDDLPRRRQAVRGYDALT